MSETFFSKALDLLASAVRPNHLMIVVTIISGFMVFDLFGFVETLDISDEVDQNRVWLALAFLICGGLQLIGLLSFSFSWVMTRADRCVTTFRTRSARVSVNASWILLLLWARMPDGTTLISSHPAVRELRRLGFIRESYITAAGLEFVNYFLTETGQIAALAQTRKHSTEPDESTQRLLKTVTGDGRL